MKAATIISSLAGSKRVSDKNIHLIGRYSSPYCSICNAIESKKIDCVVAAMGCNQVRTIATQMRTKNSWRDAALKHFTVFIKGFL